jgi:alcohol dehydrogenase class IV
MSESNTDIVVSFGFWTDSPLDEETENEVRSALITAFEDKCSKRVEDMCVRLRAENVWVLADSKSMSYEHMSNIIETLDNVGTVHNPTATTLEAHRIEFEEMGLEPPL